MIANKQAQKVNCFGLAGQSEGASYRFMGLLVGQSFMPRPACVITLK
jgi:hypothetical protein